jgi:hypothetical protein
MDDPAAARFLSVHLRAAPRRVRAGLINSEGDRIVGQSGSGGWLGLAEGSDDLPEFSCVQFSLSEVGDRRA